MNRVRLADPARSLQDSVAFPEIPPPHVLVGDLDDVSHGEPAVLSVWQADAFIHAWGKRGRTEGKEEAENKQREDLRICLFVHARTFSEENDQTEAAGLGTDAVLRIRMLKRVKGRGTLTSRVITSQRRTTCKIPKCKIISYAFLPSLVLRITLTISVGSRVSSSVCWAMYCSTHWTWGQSGPKEREHEERGIKRSNCCSVAVVLTPVLINHFIILPVWVGGVGESRHPPVHVRPDGEKS